MFDGAEDEVLGNMGCKRLVMCKRLYEVIGIPVRFYYERRAFFSVLRSSRRLAAGVAHRNTVVELFFHVALEVPRTAFPCGNAIGTSN